MEKITFCIPSKSNLEYLKTCIPSIRVNSYRKDHDIIIFVDEDRDRTIEWLIETQEQYNFQFYVNPKLGEELYGIGKAYDFCIEKSNTDIFTIFHADMIMGKDGDLHLYNKLDRGTVVCSTRIEPPLHPNNGEKIQLDLGLYPSNFKEDFFHSKVEELIQTNNDKVTEGIFAPWMMYKEDYIYLGGHDLSLHSCREDSDIFNRMLLAGFKFIQPWNSLVYHFTGRGAGSFSGDKERHNKWKEDMMNSTREFIRKWGQNVNHTNLMKPIIHPVYNKGLKLLNTTVESLYHLEPWFNNVYIDNKEGEEYIKKEQSKTSWDLAKRVLYHTEPTSNDIIVRLDVKELSQQDFNYIQNLSQIIEDSGEIGRFTLGNLHIEIKRMKEYQQDLIVCK